MWQHSPGQAEPAWEAVWMPVGEPARLPHAERASSRISGVGRRALRVPVVSVAVTDIRAPELRAQSWPRLCAHADRQQEHAYPSSQALDGLSPKK